MFLIGLSPFQTYIRWASSAVLRTMRTKHTTITPASHFIAVLKTSHSYNKPLEKRMSNMCEILYQLTASPNFILL